MQQHSSRRRQHSGTAARRPLPPSPAPRAPLERAWLRCPAPPPPAVCLISTTPAPLPPPALPPGRMLVDLAATVPDGIVCFFVSYLYMDTIVSRWHEMGVLQVRLGVAGTKACVVQLIRSLSAAAAAGAAGGTRWARGREEWVHSCSWDKCTCRLAGCHLPWVARAELAAGECRGGCRLRMVDA